MSTNPLTKRHPDPKAKGLWFRVKQDGSKVYGYTSSTGQRITVGTRDEALLAQAEAKAATYKGLPTVDRSVRIRDLVAEVRETQRENVRATTLAVDERGLDMIESAIGHLRPADLIGSDVIDRFVRDVISGKVSGGKPVSVATAKRYLHVMRHVEKIALKRGLLPYPVWALVSWPKPKADHSEQRFLWSREALSALFAASEARDARETAQYAYSPLFKTLALTGMRIGEALALRVQDVDLLAGRIEIRGTLYRDGTVAAPKTAAGRRTVTLSDSLVALLAEIVPADAEPTAFVFHAAGDPMKPLEYGNVRRRGFEPARDAAGLPKTVTLHSLRKAFVSFASASGVGLADVAGLVGHSDSSVTARVYEKPVIDPATEVAIRALQEALAA